ncbi:MAG: type II secretion system protein [Lachnospiraceae bacterium]|nr:type II secretion system protein [Lachnospiraceae bacterium]
MKIFKRQGNKGFTLVELIVTIAIMTIVGGAIASFLIVSQRQYNNGVAETDVQYDAQLVANQIHDLLIDAQRGVSYKYVGKLAEGAEESEEAPNGLIISDSDISVTDLDSKELYVYNNEKYYRIRWDEDEKKIFFSEAAKGTSISSEALLAEAVSDFSVDLSELLEKKTIRYSITFLKEESGREYTTSHAVKLRNDILMNASEDEIYVPDPPEVEATGIDVYPERVSIWPGENEKLAARVTSNVGLMPSQSVEWHFADVPGEVCPTSTGTFFSEQVSSLTTTLFIGTDEVGSTIDGEINRINVYATQDASGLRSDNIKVGIRTITELGTKSYCLSDGQVLGSSSNVQNGSYNISVAAGQENICIDLESFTGVHIGDLIVSDMEQTIDNMGGITISFEPVEGKDSEGNTVYYDYSNYLTLDTSVGEAQETGKLQFDVKSTIKYGDNGKVSVPITFKCKRERYNSVTGQFVAVQETINVVISKKETNSPIDESKGWKRNGVVDIDLSMLEDNWDNGDWVEIQVDFCDSSDNVIQHAYYGHQGGYDNDDPPDTEYSDYFVQEQSGTVCELLFLPYEYGESAGNVKLRWKASESYYTSTFCDKYGNPHSITKAKIMIIHCKNNSGERISYGPYTENIAPVNVEYSLDGINQSSWDTNGKTTIYATPFSESNSYAMLNGYYDGYLYKDDQSMPEEKYKTYRTYYRLTGGWHVSTAAEIDDYSLNDGRFVCMIDGKAGYTIQPNENRYFTMNDYTSEINHEGYIDVTSGKDAYGYYIEVKVPDSLNQYYAEKGSTMTVVYEGNWAAGIGGYYETDNFKLMDGCKYGFNIKFVTDNLVEQYEIIESVWVPGGNGGGHYEERTENYTISDLPSTQYCPSQSDLKSQGYSNNTYFYVSPRERYYIRTIRSGSRETYYITYEKYMTIGLSGISRWVSQWKDSNKYTIWFSYDQESGKWKYSNMRISY